MFKKGDSVRRINKDFLEFKVGNVYTVLEDQCEHEDLHIDVSGYASSVLACNFELVKETKSKDKEEKNLKYTFKTPWSMVEQRNVYKDLSYEKPMAILKDKGDNGRMLIHNSILLKANLCKIKLPQEVYVGLGMYAFCAIRFNQETLDEIEIVKQWIKKVKNMEWPKYNKPAEITVTVLKID